MPESDFEIEDVVVEEMVPQKPVRRLNGAAAGSRGTSGNGDVAADAQGPSGNGDVAADAQGPSGNGDVAADAQALADASAGDGVQETAANAEDRKPSGQPAVRQDGRAGVVLQNKAENFAATDGVQGSKYAVKGSSRDQFAAGLKRVSTSVQDCARRVSNKGGVMPAKIYLNIQIQPEGNVSSYEIQDAQVSEMFHNCLESKKGTWKFTPFEGGAVKIRQAFILG